MHTHELLERLQRHYIKPGAPLPGGIFLPEVGWNNGSGNGGCDAIYVGFTTTSGRTLVGHELKVSRADWLNELKKPGKADAWADQCHEWWLVVSDPGFIYDGELPAGWGLMSPGQSKTRMKVHHAANRKGVDHVPSWLAVRSIMARQDSLRAHAIAAIRQKSREDARIDVEAEVQRRLAIRTGPSTEQLTAQVSAIESAVGGRIAWNVRDKSYVPMRGEVTLQDLSAIANLARTHGEMRRAINGLTGRYTDPLRVTRDAVDQLEEAIKTLRGLAAAAGSEQQTLWEDN